MKVYLEINSVRNLTRWRHVVKITLALMLTLIFVACSANLQSKVAGNLNQLSKNQTVAILPVEVMEKDQKETAAMLRQGLYANLRGSKFKLLERYVVDSLLKQNDLTNPAKFIKINPMEFAEILGADAVLITRINKVERSYMIVHSSIEIGVSAQMVDTRTGEILWRAEQTESDYQGIAKIPTGVSSAIIGPIQFVTNKLNLHRMMSKLVNKLTAIIKNPEDAEKGETFEKPLIASAATRDLKKIEDVHNLEADWVADVDAYTKIPSNLNNIENSFSNSSGNSQADLVRPKIKPSLPIKSEEREPSHINWTPRKAILKPITQKPGVITFIQPDSVAVTPVGIVLEKSVAPATEATHGSFLRYTVQVGAYKTKMNASQMVRNLSRKGYSAHITPYLKDGMTLFKVQVEKFSDKEQANELANKLSNKENLPTFVTVINPG